MPYIEDITEPLIHVLTHTGGLPIHQLAGHMANFEFWVGEVRHAFDVIDGYQTRFKKMTQAEKDNAGRRIPPIRRGIKHLELNDLRVRLANAMYHILQRSFKEKLITELQLQQAGDTLGLDIREIKRKSPLT
ncbi:MAG: hypothetical protein R3B84_19395 [Zavarzinella sp.]